jgi:hypothetical protein
VPGGDSLFIGESMANKVRVEKWFYQILQKLPWTKPEMTKNPPRSRGGGARFRDGWAGGLTV